MYCYQVVLLLVLVFDSCGGNRSRKEAIRRQQQRDEEQPFWLSTLERYERLQSNALYSERIQNVNVATIPSHPNRNTTTTTTTIPFVNIAMMMAFSSYVTTRSPSNNASNNTNPQQQQQQQQPHEEEERILQRIATDNGVYQGMVALLLATEHLNSGNGSIIAEVTDLQNRCPLKFTTEIFDTLHSETETIDQLLTVLARGQQQQQQGQQPQLPSAFIGAYRSAVSIPMSMVTGLKGLVQLSPISTSKQLDDKSLYPLFARTVPSDDGTAIPAIQYLRYTLGVKHLAVLHVSDAYGSDYALGLKLAAAHYAPDMEIVSFDFPFLVSPEMITNTIQKIKQTQYRYIFGVIFSVHYEPFMVEAYKQQIAGTGHHHWMFSDGIDTPLLEREFDDHSIMHLASRGNTRIVAVGGISGTLSYETFLSSMKALDNPQDIQFIETKYPHNASSSSSSTKTITNRKHSSYERLSITEDPYFFDKATHELVTFLYDGVIALGLAACKATTRTTTTTTGNGTERKAYFDGETLFQELKNITFDGVTGRNVFDSVTGTRITSSARFVLQNFVELPTEDTDTWNHTTTQTIRLKVVETDVFLNGTWINRVPLVFNDGTTVPPLDLPWIEVNNETIGTTIRIALFLMSITIILLSIMGSIITYKRRHTRVIRASQPFFLYCICFGCFLMGIPIIFISMDDEVIPYKENATATTTTNNPTCTILCILIPWMGAMGFFIVFAALFTKVNKIFKVYKNGKSATRINITVSDILRTWVACVSLCIIILSLWTALAPPLWQRKISSVDRFQRPTETSGSCIYFGAYYNGNRTGSGLPFVCILGLTMFGIVFTSLYQAYRTREISTEFKESEYIFLIIIGTLSISFTGVPLVAVSSDARGGGNPKQFAFLWSSVAFLFCLQTLLLIFIPKIVWLQRGGRTSFSKSDFFTVTGRIMDTPTTPKAFSRANPRTTTSQTNAPNDHIPPKKRESTLKHNNELLYLDDDQENDMIIIHASKQIEQIMEKVKSLRIENSNLYHQLQARHNQSTSQKSCPTQAQQHSIFSSLLLSSSSEDNEEEEKRQVAKEK